MEWIEDELLKFVRIIVSKWIFFQELTLGLFKKKRGLVFALNNLKV